MSSMNLTFSGSIIGISYGEMNSVKSNLRRASDMLQQSQSKVNSAKVKVQVDRSSSRLRLSEEQISTIYTTAAKQKTKIDKLCNNIDITIRKFKEVDARCAARIRSISKSYDKSKSLWDRIKSAVSSFSAFAMNGFKSLIDMGKEAFSALGQKITEGFNAVSEWMDKHPVITNVVSGALDALTIVGATAAIVAGTVTGVGIVFAVVGAVYAASTLIDSGVKIYNNIKNGTNSGFNFIEEGFKKVMGDTAGEMAFGVTNLIALAVNLPSMAKGALKLGTGAINFFKEGEGIAKIGASISGIGKNISSFLDEGKSAFKALGELGTSKLDKFLESVKDVKNNIGKTLEEIKVNIRSIEESLVYETNGNGNNNHFYEFIDNRTSNTPDNYKLSDVDEIEDAAKRANDVERLKYYEKLKAGVIDDTAWENLGRHAEKNNLDLGKVPWNEQELMLNKYKQEILDNTKLINIINGKTEKLLNLSDIRLKELVDSGYKPNDFYEILNTDKSIRSADEYYKTLENTKIFNEWNSAFYGNDSKFVISYMPKDAYEKFVLGYGSIGRGGEKGGQFVLPQGVSDAIESKLVNKGSITNITDEFKIELAKELGLPSNVFESGVVKVEIPLTDNIDLRMVTGIEDGCNYQWIPGGKTLGGTPEGIIPQITSSNDTELFEGIISRVNEKYNIRRVD